MSTPAQAYTGVGRNGAPIYQIDFTAVASGKRIASTKRRVRWRFGFANVQALSRGATGTDCRGEEHDVTLVWSITSGKRLVICDGQEVHYSTSRGNIFDYTWTMRGQHVMKLVAHAAPPMAPQPGFRQYDLFINGQSFFILPKVFRLGLSPASFTLDPRQHARGSSRRHVSSSTRSAQSADIGEIESPHNPDEEEAYLQEAIRQSLQDDVPPKKKEPDTSGTADLLDFGGDTQTSTSMPVAPNPFASTTSGEDAWGLAVVPLGGSYGYSTQPPGAELAALPPTNAPNMNGYVGASGEAYGSQKTPDSEMKADTPMNGGSNPFSNPFEVPAPSAAPSNPGHSNVTPIETQFQGMGLGDGSVPPAVTPQYQPTPSSLGFGSPPPDFSGFSPTPMKSASASQPPGNSAPDNGSGVAISDRGVAEPTAGGGPMQSSMQQVPALQTATQQDPSIESAAVASGSKDETGTVNPPAPNKFSQILNANSFSLETKPSVPAPVANPSPEAAAPPYNPFTDLGAMVVSSNQNTAYGSQYGVALGSQTGQAPMKAPPMQYPPTSARPPMNMPSQQPPLNQPYQQTTPSMQQPYQQRTPMQQPYQQTAPVQRVPSIGVGASRPPPSGAPPSGAPMQQRPPAMQQQQQKPPMNQPYQQTPSMQQPYQQQTLTQQYQQTPPVQRVPSMGSGTPQFPSSQAPMQQRPPAMQQQDMYRSVPQTMQPPMYQQAPPLQQQYSQSSQPPMYGYGQSGAPPAQYGYPPQYGAGGGQMAPNPYGQVAPQYGQAPNAAGPSQRS